MIASDDPDDGEPTNTGMLRVVALRHRAASRHGLSIAELCRRGRYNSVWTQEQRDAAIQEMNDEMEELVSTTRQPCSFPRCPVLLLLAAASCR